ncbi:MAG TPA: hypothetical protein VM219_10490 [Phycisphaerae bacterium]|nr:hypothetical protein [Phycisphaerae bacterium]
MPERDQQANRPARLPLDVRFVAGLAILATLGGLANAYKTWNLDKGGFVLGVICTESTSLAIAYHLAAAAYMAVLSRGLFRMRAYGFWLLVASIGAGLVLAPLQLIWVRPIIPEEAQRLWTILFLIGVAATVGLAIWCFYRRGLFIRNPRCTGPG